MRIETKELVIRSSELTDQEDLLKLQSTFLNVSCSFFIV